MRCLVRNKRTFWYALYKSQTAQTDANGNETGEPFISYETPIQMSANISEATGQSYTDIFGNLPDYDKVIVTDDMSCPIDENTVLCIDCEPSYLPQTDPKRLIYDYIVRRVAKSINSISIACSKVKVG